MRVCDAWCWLTIGVTVETIGYVARVISANDPTKKMPFILQFVLIILAPVLMAGVIYVLFSRIVFWVVPPESRTFSFIWVPRKWQRPNEPPALNRIADPAFHQLASSLSYSLASTSSRFCCSSSPPCSSRAPT